MPVIKCLSNKNATRLINACKTKAIEVGAHNCLPQFAKEQMQGTREVWDKTDGIQAHHVIQSFSLEDNITAREANEVGRRLAEAIAENYQVVIYTVQTNKLIYNSIIINSVSFVDGRKYHSTRTTLYRIRKLSDELCPNMTFSYD